MKIHAHPQKTDYASPAEWPTRSFQHHWKASDAILVPPPANPQTGHLHIDMTYPEDAEWATGTLTIPFKLKLFHVAGRITQVFAAVLQSHNAREIIWDATGTTTPPSMIGDINSLKEWSGHFVIDPPSNPRMPEFLHGWIFLSVSAAMQFDNGVAVTGNSLGAVWSMVDPSLPPVGGFHLPTVGSRTMSKDPSLPNVFTGANQMDAMSFLPLAPISTPWEISTSAIQYAAQSPLPIATFELRADLDLHAGIPGRVLQRVVKPPDGGFVSVLDPKVIGPGVHRIAMMLIQPLAEIQEVTTLLVFDVTIGDVPPAELVVVPNVVGEDQSAAAAILEAAGLHSSPMLHENEAPKGQVFMQDPSAGSSVQKGWVVSLMVSEGPIAPPHQDMRPVEVFQLLENGKPVNRFFACFDSPDGTHEVCAELMVKPS